MGSEAPTAETAAPNIGVDVPLQQRVGHVERPEAVDALFGCRNARRQVIEHTPIGKYSTMR